MAARNGPRGRRFAGNINQGEGGSLPHWDDLPEDWVRYMYWQKEQGAGGRPHLQMYVETTSTVAAARVRNLFGGFWEPARGSLEQNKVYCGKDEGRLDGPWEIGTPVKQGQAASLAKATQDVRKRGYSKAFEEDPGTFIRFGRGLKEWAQLCAKKARGADYRAPEILVLVGKPGVGKTRLAREIPSKGVYLKDCASKWWDSYEDQETIVLDDFYGQIAYSELLRLLDGYPQQKESKGSHVWLSVRRWIITSNQPPWQWYRFNGSKEALYDRLWDRFDSCVYDLESASELGRPGTQ